ncbi:hypothetical protein MVEN_01958100 [Mycena venus]|uniref:F-box domain-containing protein n=1 Tax=Mycena venus TaxID=2733690 RepID=A0A8H6XH08_9AGAR|nr:hypothetical protein MVEN_01958100 [Mycena venus]
MCSDAANGTCTSRHHVPRLPQEILDVIVDNVEDMVSLEACSLVCWAFVPASRKHIFRAISLEMLTDAPLKLHATLLRSPHIASYIRDFAIRRTPNPNLSPYLASGGDWTAVPPSLASAILRLISLETLERLHILNVSNVSAALLHSALSLRVLSLYYVSLDPSPDSHITARLEGFWGYMQSLGSTHFSNVRQLAVNPIPNSRNSPQNFARILSAVELTLERLDIQWYELSFEQFNVSGVDTSRLRLLRTVQLHIIMEEPGVIVPKYLPHAIHNLVVGNPLLESITFVLHIPNVSGAEVPGLKDVARRLRKLDAYLGGSDIGRGFPALREAIWKIVPECSPPSLVPDYAAFFQTNLSRTHSRGILSVEQGCRKRGKAVVPWLPHMSV